MAKWTVYASFTFAWCYSFACIVVADRPIEFFAASIAVIVVPFCMIPMIEEVEQ